MARQTSINFTGGLQYTYATAPTDLFKKEDVQLLAVAQDQHDHSPGKGLALNGSSIVDGTIAAVKMAPGAVANQAVGGDLRGTVADARVFIDQSRGLYEVSSTGDHPVITFGGENLFWASSGGGYRWVNQGNTAQWMALDTAGNLNIQGSFTATGNISANGQVISAARMTSHSDLVVDAGTIWFSATDGTTINHAGLPADNIGLPTTVWFGPARDVYLQRDAPGSLTMSGAGSFKCNVGGSAAWWYASTLYLNTSAAAPFIQNAGAAIRYGASLHSFELATGGLGPIQAGMVNATGGLQVAGSAVFSCDIQMANPRQIAFNAGEVIAPGENVSRANTVYIANHAYIFFDLGVGHIVTCQSLTQTSDPRAKQSATVIPDTDCMTRVRAPIPVYTYQLPPPVGGNSDSSTPIPTANDIGLMADDVAEYSPEFVSHDADGNAVGLNYPNMAALLWGALRALDQRCIAKGI